MPRYGRTASYLMCRTLGHAWDVVDAERVGRYGGTPVWLRCMRCTTERHDAVSSNTGELIGRNYVYDTGYRHAFDESFTEAPTKSDYRRMLLAEHIIKRRSERAITNEGDPTHAA